MCGRKQPVRAMCPVSQRGPIGQPDKVEDKRTEEGFRPIHSRLDIHLAKYGMWEKMGED